jgi:hypothetical protein
LEGRPSQMVAETDPERTWVQIRRQDLSLLLALGLAVFDKLAKTHPTSRRTWELGQAISAAERLLLGDAPLS